MNKATRVNTTKIDAAGLVSALLVSLLLAYVLIGGDMSEASGLKAEALTLSDELSYLEALSQSIEQGELTIETLEDNMRAVENRLPDTMDFEKFRAILTARAQEEGVRVSEVKHGEAIDLESHREMAVSVSGIAEFESIHNFLFSLSTLERLTTIESLSIRVSDVPHLCDIDMVVKIYSTATGETAHGE